MKNISLKSKILILSAFMVLVSVSVGAVSFWSTGKTVENFSQVVDHEVPSIRAFNRMILSFRLARIEVLQLVSQETDDQRDQESLKLIEAAWKAFDADDKIFVSHIESDVEKKLYDEFKTAIGNVRAGLGQVAAAYAQGSGDRSPEFKQMYRIILKEIGGPLGTRVDETAKALRDNRAGAIDEFSAQANASARLGNRIILWVTVLGSVLGLGFAYLFSLRMSAKIQSIVANISNSTASVSSASSQIASASQSLAQAVTEQASSLQQTTSSLEEISAMIAKSSDNASVTDQNAQGSLAKAHEGQSAVIQMSDSMTEISHSNDTIMIQIDHSNQQMTEIIKVIQDIGTKTKVINEIVFQTKLLSFNASVEAARAGEHGKGFAVVAEEIGSLAQMSGNAAKEISEMLEISNAKVVGIVNETKEKVSGIIHDGKRKVKTGVDLAQRCSDYLDEIVQNVSQVTGLAQDISMASKEQTQGVDEIKKAMTQLDEVTHRNSTASHEAASAAESLSAQANLLKSAVHELEAVVMGAQSHESSNDVVANGSNSGAVVRLFAPRNQKPQSRNRAA